VISFSNCKIKTGEWCVFASQYIKNSGQKNGKMNPLPGHIPMTWKGRKHRLKSKLGFSNFIPAKWVESIGGYSQDVIIDGKVVSTLSDGKCKFAVLRKAIG
jgi:hypothetical protein